MHPRAAEPVVNNSVSLKPSEMNQLHSSLKHWLQSDAAVASKLTQICFLQGSIREDTFLGTTKTGLPQLLESSTIHYPKTFPSFLANIWFVVLVLDSAFPGCDTSWVFSMFLISLHLPFSSRVRQRWGLDCYMARCDSSNTLWFIKDILLAHRG